MQDLFDSTVALSPPTATLLLSLILPLLVAAGTKLVAPAWVKSLVSLALATVLAVVTLLSQAGVEGVPLKRVLALVIVTLISSNLAYNTLWKPLGVWPLIQNWTSGFGVGGGKSEQPLNPADVATPPPGGFGEGANARLMDIEYTMETGIGFGGEGNITRQVLVDGVADSTGLGDPRPGQIGGALGRNLAGNGAQGLMPKRKIADLPQA